MALEGVGVLCLTFCLPYVSAIFFCSICVRVKLYMHAQMYLQEHYNLLHKGLVIYSI